MNDRIRDLPHMKQLTGQRQLLRGLLAVAGMARPLLRLARRDTASFDQKIAEWRKWEQVAFDLETVPDRFNELFAGRGWIIYEDTNFELITACVAKAEAGDFEGAERDLVEHFTPEHIRWKLMLMRGVRAFEPRLPLAEKALVDYTEGRYYASVLVTLSLLDGLVNDLHHRQVGFFARGVELSAWDSVSAHSTGLEKLSRVLQEPRNKTVDESISLPYRHGIVHGRDLGYDNKTVAAKSWAALFAVRDWAQKAEQKKLGPPPPKEKPTILQMLRQHAAWQKENAALQQVLSAWRPRSIEVGRDCPATGEVTEYPEGSPERAALEFFFFMKRGNYGGMVRSLDAAFVGDTSINRLAGEFRTRFGNTHIESVELLRISDLAPAISLVALRVRGDHHEDQFDQEVELRLIYQGGRHGILPRGVDAGTWRLVFLPSLPSDPADEEDDTGT